MKHTIILVCLILACKFTYGQKQDCINIYFDRDSYTINPNLEQNAQSLPKLQNIFSALAGGNINAITHLVIFSYASPEGGNGHNMRLSARRSECIRSYLVDELQVPDSLIEPRSGGIDWGKLRQIVDSSSMSNKQAVLEIIDSRPNTTYDILSRSTVNNFRKQRLKDLDDSRTYDYMLENLFNRMRNSDVVTIFYEVAPSNLSKIKSVSGPEASNLKYKFRPYTTECTQTKPLLALKTNLLFDAMTMLNIEIEVPIGRRWSVAGEFIFPWWTWDNLKPNSKRNRLQLLNGNLEGRYWIDRDKKSILTGWFAGFYAGGGSYDFEHKARGYQGEFFIAAGLSGGYAHTINKAKTLRMEYSLGFGYLRTNYKYYEANCYFGNRWHPVLHRMGDYTWIGPTRAKISLSWLINYKSNKFKL